MKKIFFVFYLFVLLFCDAISQITEEERKNLFNKFVKKIDVLNPNDFIRPLNDVMFKKFSYDSNKIKNIISDHKFPENYNFFEDKKVQKHIKNQGSCGCGWAFASTSALGYRYSRDGEDINLSPQNVLSCLTKNCEAFVHVLDAELYLAQKGTTTESCNPYSSADGKTIENCPTKCQGNEEFKIYYAKNTYSTILDYYDSETYYKVVTLIMDQLVNFGPVTAQIDYYKDLVELGYKSNCKSTIYKYDGKSELVTIHAVVIVGYGHEDSKYYWIIQNSFGEDFCDGGLAKIEFNELGIENIAFNEPQTEIPSGKTFKAIMKLEENCKISYTTDSDEYYDINFDLSFTSEDSQNQFYYQCGKNPKINEKGGICSFSYENYIQNNRGFYKHSYTSPIRSINFILDNYTSFDKNGFYFYSNDQIHKLNDHYYVSGEGSEITLEYKSQSNDMKDRNLKAQIYLNENTQNSLKNCQLSETKLLGDSYLIKCKFTQNDVDFIGENNNNESLFYDVLCGDKQSTSAIVHKLDKTRYPIFKVKSLILPEEEILRNDFKLYMVVDIEGSVSGMKDINENSNSFVGFIKIFKNKQISYQLILCHIPILEKLQENLVLECSVHSNNVIEYDNVQLLPYYSNYDSQTPFEFIIKDNIQVFDYDEVFNDDSGSDDFYDITFFITSESKFIQSSLLILLFLVLTN